MLDTPCSEVVWRVLATHSIRQFPLHFPFRDSPCVITSQLVSSSNSSSNISSIFSVRYLTCRSIRCWQFGQYNTSFCYVNFSKWTFFSMRDIGRDYRSDFRCNSCFCSANLSYKSNIYSVLYQTEKLLSHGARSCKTWYFSHVFSIWYVTLSSCAYALERERRQSEVEEEVPFVFHALKPASLSSNRSWLEKYDWTLLSKS